MNTKEYLSQAYQLDQRINSKLELVESLNALATKCTSTITGMPKNPNRGNSTMADAIEKIMDLQNEINMDIERSVELKRDIISVIKDVDNTEYQTLLIKRYLSYKSWKQTAFDMNYSTRWIHIVHSKALKIVSEKLSERAEYKKNL